ncbi:MAG: L-glutamate gamma-semialdehyde dehydrogenase [Bacteroidales bacterium]|nr:L-glutamate gamma-semialdehyde dehydrogenase [Bacteroidales bacterium]
MDNILYTFERPENEPVYGYAPGSKEREALKKALKNHPTELEIPLIIGGKEVRTGNIGKVVEPHRHSNVLATYHKAGEKEVKEAIKASQDAYKEWSRMPWLERAAVMNRIAELISTKYRYVLNASLMLGQSKNPMQAEIDAPCELIDFIRFGNYCASRIFEDQPLSVKGQNNRVEYRPLEGFVYTLTPFNFTSIASNLNLAPALMGNTTIWKPSTTALYSNYLLMKIFKEAGLPDGVVNFIPGKGSEIGKVLINDPNLAGFHFTGSTATFNYLWSQMGANLDKYKSYPIIVGETGGKNFIVAHNSAPVEEVAVAIVRGAFEYQGQKCSAASRAYIPKSMWKELRERLEALISTIKMGDVRDFSNFMNAVIDEVSFDNIKGFIDEAEASSESEVIIGGGCDKSEGYFVEPTVILTTNPHSRSMVEEIFGPVITVFVYDDEKYDEMLSLVDSSTKYGLTGSVFARDRMVINKTMEVLRFTAGNFYINDKPTGAVVGQQPFGGSRASGTNDKAGSSLNLIRWINPRCVKETYVPPTDYTYPFLSEEK